MINFLKKDKKEPKNLKEVIIFLKNLEKDLKKVSSDMRKLKKENEFAVQKIGIVRFNPFKEAGGDQSFSVALLNKNDTGVIITSLYSKEGNRIYGKSVKDGKSPYLLSKEEKEAIDKAGSYKKEEV